MDWGLALLWTAPKHERLLITQNSTVPLIRNRYRIKNPSFSPHSDTKPSTFAHHFLPTLLLHPRFKPRHHVCSKNQSSEDHRRQCRRRLFKVILPILQSNEGALERGGRQVLRHRARSSWYGKQYSSTLRSYTDCHYRGWRSYSRCPRGDYQPAIRPKHLHWKEAYWRQLGLAGKKVRLEELVDGCRCSIEREQHIAIHIGER
jgi:hypothetical protein